MTDKKAPPISRLGVLIGALIALALAVFFVSGGEYVGKTTVNSDADLPPVATGGGKIR
jgi:hypothetical protein